MNNIKDYRSKELLAYVMANTLLFLLCSDLLDGIMDYNIDSFISLTSSILGSVVYGSICSIYVFIIDSLIPGDWKGRIAWLGKHRLPGCRIFSDIKTGNRDIRFTKEEALKKYESVYNGMPSDKKEMAEFQNSEWYKLFKKHQNAGSVLSSSRDYLLCRDLFISTVSMLVLYLIGSFFYCVFQRKCIFSQGFFAILIFEWLMTNIAMRSQGWRYVYNVIAEDIDSE